MSVRILKMRKSPTGVVRTVFQGRIIFVIYDLRYANYERHVFMHGHRKSETANSKSFFLGSPALAHEGEEMLHGFLVGAALGGGELMGAFVQLRSHVGGLLRRTAEGHEDAGEFGEFHGSLGFKRKEFDWPN